MHPSPANEILIRAEDLRLYFDEGQTRALDGVSLAVRQGEFVAMVGPSGCGKSSLLNIIGTLDIPTSGIIRYRDTAYAQLPNLALFRRQHIGFVFQSFNLIATLSALDNVLVATLGGPASSAASRDKAEALLTRLGLGQRMNHLPGKLSGGERQRVAIARALINDPDIILADEPTGSLDSASAEQVLAVLEEVRRERGLTIVMVTHDASVSAHADRIIRLRDGKLDAQQGTAA
ncbi:MAG: ABC transporter ATP-binding protein [Gallionella sp.]|nr:ABC transporter ATP-binding protein [Gallionella sp.]MDD4946386.1 ABC transporter ATP-binding protein [Gallionella sp.]MDD5612817.1 ABC transporter ATP-binding protein [Gallionella sp.]